MTEHVLVVRVHARVRHDYAVAQPFRYAARAFIQHSTDNVGLLEVGVIRVQDQRLLLELMLEGAREAGVPTLRHPCGILRSLLFFRIVVNVEMGGRHDPPIEILVLNLLPAEILRLDNVGCDE